MTDTAVQPDIAIRPAGAGDLGFLLKSYLLTLRHNSHLSWYLDSDTFFEGEQALVKRVMARETCRCLVACPPDDPEVVLGFAIYEPGVLHMVYVKAAFRRGGISRALLRAAELDPEAGFEASVAVHDSTKGWIREKYPSVITNPYRRMLP